jgi:hypothetical protein
MTIAKDPLFFSQFLNPALAGLIDTTAAQVAPGMTKKSGAGATATATATAGGGTAKATATAGGATATATAGAGGAHGAGKALGLNVGEAVGEQLKGAIGSFAKGFAEGLIDGLTSAFCPEPPNPSDNAGKIGSLKTDAAAGIIETGGGYKIEMKGQFEWNIIGPDGNKTRIWGDPHVETIGKDGKIQEKWDFKKDSTFVLPDGTKINVKCAPWGNGSMTVTSQLEILHGNDRVVVTDIDKGKGKVGQVQQGVIESFKTEQTFVAGRNVADWYYDGHQVLANLGGEADRFNTDSKDPVFDIITTAAHAVGAYGGAHGNGGGINQTWLYGEPLNTVRFHGEEHRNNALQKVLDQVLPLVGQLTDLLKGTQSHNAYRTPEPEPAKQTQTRPYDPNEHRQGLSNALRAIGTLFQALASLIEMMGALKTTRAPQTA